MSGSRGGGPGLAVCWSVGCLPCPGMEGLQGVVEAVAQWTFMRMCAFSQDRELPCDPHLRRRAVSPVNPVIAGGYWDGWPLAQSLKLSKPDLLLCLCFRAAKEAG